MTILDMLKSCLIDLKYPGITLMCEDEIANIFDKENRIYFLIWFTKKYDPEIVLPLPSDGNTIIYDILVDVLYENGFCSFEDGVRFVHSYSEFSPDEQVVLFTRLLYNLRILTSEEATSKDFENNYIEEIRKFANLELNIFPSLGPLKTRTPQERQRKLEEDEQNITKVKEKIEQVSSKCDMENQFAQDETGTILSKKPTFDGCEINYVEEMQKLSNLNVSILPSLDPLKTRELQSRQRKLEKVEEDIINIKVEITKISSKSNMENRVSQYETRAASGNANLKHTISVLMSNIACLLHEQIKEEKQTFNNSFENLTLNCAANMLAVLKMCETKKLMSDVMIQELQRDKIEEAQGNATILEDVKRLADLAEEILKI